MKWTSSNTRKAAMTLVEVVAGLALLATLMAFLLAIKTDVLHQNRLTQRRRQAVAAADQLLAQWWQNPKTFPRSAAGALPSGLEWRTQIIATPPAAALGAQVVRLNVFDQAGADVVVEVLLPTWGQ